MLRSIRARLLAFSAVLTLAALVLAWIALSSVLADFVDRRLAAELTAAARGVMAASGWDAATGFSVTPPPPDPRFEKPLSGWYWQVSDGARVLARAPSLVTGDLGAAGALRIGPDGVALIGQATSFTAPGDGQRLTVVVTLPAAEAATELAAIRRPLALALGVLGAVLLAAQVIAVRAGLSDLTRFKRGVAAVRDGAADSLPAEQAEELRPLAQELNRLIAANAAQLERARAHAGDLAHALKTPLAVLANRADPSDAALITRMDRIIRWQLKRTRSAAHGLAPLSAFAAVAPVLEDVTLVLGPEAKRRGVALTLNAAQAPDFRGDPEDLAEIIGALAENAVAWAHAEVRIIARPCADGLELCLSDDGPGIAAEDRARLLRRGARLDEGASVHGSGHGSGHGLGLAIAFDRVLAYGGQMQLDDAPCGGLMVIVHLPARPGPVLS